MSRFIGLSLIIHALGSCLFFIFFNKHDRDAPLSSAAIQIVDENELKKIQSLGSKDGKLKFDHFKISPSANASSAPTISSYSSEDYQENLNKYAIKQKFPTSTNYQLANPGPLKNYTYGFMIEPPQGVSFDQLNELELKFYGFAKRVGEKYLNSALSTYLKKAQIYPKYLYDIDSSTHLVARAVYDQGGNLLSVKILNGSSDQKIQSFFEEVITSMTTIANPPEFITKDGQFTALFQMTFY